MPSEKQPFYDPVPPTYDEALASSSRSSSRRWATPAAGHDEQPEAQALLLPPHAESSSARPRGYRPPTVETDDEEDSLAGMDSDDDDDDDDDDDETAQVRREMHQMEVQEPASHGWRGSVWSKRIAFSLPRWKWSWRPRLRLPRLRIRLPASPATFSPLSSPAPASAPAPAAPTAPLPTDDDDAADDGEARRRRWPLPRMDKLTIVLVFARLLALVIVLGFLYFLFASGIFGGLSSRLGGGMRFDPEDLRVHMQRSVDPMRLRATVEHFSHYAHMAGTEGDYATAMDVESMFSRAGLDKVEVDEYFVYVNYPRKDGRAVQILDPAGGDSAIWSARLDEDERGGETAGRQTYAFHGHSRSGDVRGRLLYANYGSREDFQRLQDSGIDIKGAIALVRYYGTQTDDALKVKAAELAGFAGCLIYSDPADDGFVQGEVAPQGRFMPADGVQRGAVSMMSRVVGDVLTPGWESKKNMPRMRVNDTAGLVRIPSLPLSSRDAQVLLQHLQGHGDRVPAGWTGGVPDVGAWWWTGNGSSPVVRLRNEQDEMEQQPVWNVYGKIVGMEQTARSVLVGNHRDAWAFGAVDAHAGTAVMVELAAILGDLRQRGWRPLRTIEFMSWDAEAYNMIGSTEFVEKNLDALRDSAYAYVNLDAAVTGTQLRAAGSPALRRALLRALGRVADPQANATLRDLWRGQLEGLGAGGDYAAFQHIAGTSSLDLAFVGERYARHSSYANFDLVDRVMDPGFVYHALLGQVVGLLLLDLADRAVLPLDMGAYADALQGWASQLGGWIADRGGNGDEGSSLPVKELEDAAAMIKRNADEFGQWELEWHRLVLASGGWETNDQGAARMRYNDKMAGFETALLDLEFGGGIPNRTQFKHVVVGPQLWSGHDAAFFPAIRDSVEARDWDLARRVMAKTSAILRRAATMIQMDER